MHALLVRACAFPQPILRLDDGLLHVPDKQVVAPKRLTLEELKAYNGEDKTKPIYLAIRGVIFDVSRGAACLGEHAHMCGSMRMCLHA